MTDEVFLNRKEAEAYLRKKFGSPGTVTAKTLAKAAVQGGGPVMHKFGNRVSYLPKNLDAWAIARLSGPFLSTSDMRNTKPRKPRDARSPPHSGDPPQTSENNHSKTEEEHHE